MVDDSPQSADKFCVLQLDIQNTEMLHHLKKRLAAPTTRSSSQQQPGYRWCYVEQVDQAAPLANRSNGWRYKGPRGVMYRRQAVFGTGYRVRILASSHGPGYRWFNSHPVGGDPSLVNFQSWAGRMWRRGLVHPRDAEAWKTAFIDIEGGGQGQLVVSAADDTWRVILCWASAGRRIEVDPRGIPFSLVDLQVRSGIDSQSPRFRQLNIASFGHRLVQYTPMTTFGKIWQEQLPGACLAVLIADAWRDSQVIQGRNTARNN